MEVYAVANNIISPLGFTSEENFSALEKNTSGIRKINKKELYPSELFLAPLDWLQVEQQFESIGGAYTPLEKICILSISQILQQVPSINKERLALIVSTTKGNIDLLNNDAPANIDKDRVKLPVLANTLKQFFDIPSNALVVSNACISGVSAILTGKKMIEMGIYDHAMIVGADILSEFTLAGFNCLKAIDEEPCKPYDADRKGISLGEACGTMLISNNPSFNQKEIQLAKIMGGGQANDANHISGPSRTGEGLKLSIQKALKEASIQKESIQYINAHGTATLFNDEMESIAFHDMGMQNIPLNSLKAYFGHTLGAAGVLESILSIFQMNTGKLIQSKGYQKQGISKSLNVLKENVDLPEIKYILKTVSGFGGCNAAIIFQKVMN